MIRLPSKNGRAYVARTERMIDRVDTKTTAIGERFRANIDDPIVVGNQVAIPRSADATVQVMQVEGKTELAIKLCDITLNESSYDVVTNYAQLEAAGSSRGAKAARYLAGLAPGLEQSLAGAGPLRLARLPERVWARCLERPPVEGIW